MQGGESPERRENNVDLDVDTQQTGGNGPVDKEEVIPLEEDQGGF